MYFLNLPQDASTVALRLECVDRNTITAMMNSIMTRSHSVWSAWIEIFYELEQREPSNGRTPFGVRG